MINSATLKLIKEFEGLSLKPYYCSANKLTIGYGHVSDDFFEVKKGITIDQDKAEELLIHDLREAEDTLQRQFPTWETLNENQYGALLSLVYNLGPLKTYNKEKKKFTDRTILIKLKKNDLKGAAEAFLLYDKGGGKVLPGLTKRREAEKLLFETPPVL